MLTFSAITPHPPILIPSIGKENLGLIKKTVKAMKKLEEELYASQPEVIVIISPHGPILAESFSVSQAKKYHSTLEQFGDFTTKLEFRADSELIYKIKENLETKIPLVLISQEELDHGASVPLFYLTQHLKDIAIVPIGYSLLNFQKHFEFGQSLKEEIIKTNKRIAIIASGDLSHRLTQDAPAGFSPQGKIFDQTLIDLIKRKDVKTILNLDSNFIEEAGECGLRSIIILFGLLQKINYQPKILSYEGPFGVGYLVARFKF
jgi:AmmeMemoRadiSam system protein B